jgi:autotransporter passenger strand-loop-strand repeat protein
MEFQSGSLPGKDNKVLSGGVLSIGLGTEPGNIEAANGAILQLTMGGTWFVQRPTDYTVTSSGTSIKKTGTSSSTSNGIVYAGYTGWDMKTSGCTLNIVDYASAAFVKVSSGCSLALGGGHGYGAGAAGQIDVYNGGSAILEKADYVGLATVHSGGTMTLGAYSENTTVMENGGFLRIVDESILLPDLYPDYDLNVKIKPNTFKDLVLSGAFRDATAHSGTVASHTTLKDSASLSVYNGGLAVNTVLSGGCLVVESGGVASGVSVEGASKGLIRVSGGGKITGKLNFGSVNVFVEDGGIVDFDISALTGSTNALLTNYNMIVLNSGELRNTITVSGASQTKGVYALTTQAYSLRMDSDYRSEQQKIFSICDKTGMKLGAVRIGTKTMIGGQTYALNLNGSGDLSLTVASYVEGEDLWYEKFGFADDGWNDYLCDKRNELNPNASKFVTTAVSASTADILLDSKNTVSKDGKKNYVGGGGDATDFARITMKNAAKLSLTINTTDAAKFTLWRLIPGRGGSFTTKAVQTATLRKNKKTGEYEATTKALLVHPGEEFYVSMQSTNAKKGGEAFYNVTVNKDDSVFFTKGNNNDDWGDLEWMGEDGKVDTTLPQLKTGRNNGQKLCGDWVGFGDAVDYKRIRVAAKTKVVFTVESTDAAMFSLNSLTMTGGDYSLKTLASSKLAKSKASGGKYVAQKETVLEAGDYYLCMESTNAEKGGDADYTVSVSSYSFTKGNNSDDTAATAKNLGTLSGEARQKVSQKVYDDWVGYEDEYDYRKVTLASAARLRFNVVSDEATVFSVCQAGGKNGSLKTLQTTKVTKGKGDAGCAATTKELLLEAGEYYFRMQSANAKKYGYSDYTVNLSDAVFFADGDDGKNGFLCDAKKKLNGNAATFQSTNVTGGQEILVDKKGSVSRKVDGVTYRNFVGFGDETDYAKFTLANNGKLYFTVTATDAAKFTVCKLVAGKNDTFTAKSLLSGKLTKGKQDTVYSFESAKGLQLKAGETYYIRMESTNAKKSEYGAYYNVSVEFEQMDEVKEGKYADALAGVELGWPDGGPNSDELFAGLSDAASNLAGAMETGSQSAWRDLASLA